MENSSSNNNNSNVKVWRLNDEIVRNACARTMERNHHAVEFYIKEQENKNKYKQS